MNNSKFTIESVPLSLESEIDNSPTLRKEEGRLLKIVEALEEIKQTKAWSTLKYEVFDSLVETLEKALTDEGKKESPDTLKLNRLAGQLKWAEKFSDLSKLKDAFHLQLQNVRKQINGKEER